MNFKLTMLNFIAFYENVLSPPREIHKLFDDRKFHRKCSSPSTWDTPCKINFFDVSGNLDKKKTIKYLVQKEGEIFDFFFKLRM